MPDAPTLPYVPTVARLALALAVGLFVGIERERRKKEAGLRTFAFAGLLGATGSTLGPTFALLSLILIGILIVLLNLETIRTGEGAEITTSAALLTVTLCGVLAGQGEMLIAGSLGVVTAALLAWKEPLAGFSQTLTDAELRSAVMLAILAIVIYPVLPEGAIDPWNLVSPRAVWVAILLVAGLGFFNYILLKIYGPHAIEVTGFLGGLVNSTVTTAELAGRAGQSHGALQAVAFRGIVLATCAMLQRNAVIVGVLAPRAFLYAILPLALMIGGSAAIAFVHYYRAKDGRQSTAELPKLESPFSLLAALRFGLIFLALTVSGTLAQRWLGAGGFYGVSIAGGLISSATAVASAATLAGSENLSPQLAGLGAVLASLSSTFIHFPLALRVAGKGPFARNIGIATAGILLLGVAGMFLMPMIPLESLFPW